MDQGDKFGSPAPAQRLLDLRGSEDAAPLGAHLDRAGAAALGHLDHACAKDAVDPNDDLVSGFNQVGQTGFHARAAGAGDGQGHFVPGLEHKPQQLLGPIHQFDERGIEVTDQGGGHRLQNARMDVARTRTEQDPLRNGQVTNACHVCSPRRSM